MSVLRNKANPFFTYGLKSLECFRVSNGIITNFNEQPKSFDQVIVIWRHNINHPDVFLGSDGGPTDSNFYNHYSLLNVTHSHEFKCDLELPYGNKDDKITDSTNPITLMTPDGKTRDGIVNHYVQL
jgi:hypothetical protein